MATKVAINGFGRIGRLVARAILERDDHDLELVAINDLADAKSNALLFGSIPRMAVSPAGESDGSISVNGKRIAGDRRTRSRASCRTRPTGIDIVLECTGFFQSNEAPRRISMPAPSGC